MIFNLILDIFILEIKYHKEFEYIKTIIYNDIGYNPLIIYKFKNYIF